MKLPHGRSCHEVRFVKWYQLKSYAKLDTNSNDIKISALFRRFHEDWRWSWWKTSLKAKFFHTDVLLRWKEASFSVALWLETLSVKSSIVACHTRHATMELSTESVSSQTLTEKDACFDLTNSLVWKNQLCSHVRNRAHLETAPQTRKKALSFAPFETPFGMFSFSCWELCTTMSSLGAANPNSSCREKCTSAIFSINSSLNDGTCTNLCLLACAVFEI